MALPLQAPHRTSLVLCAAGDRCPQHLGLGLWVRHVGGAAVLLDFFAFHPLFPPCLVLADAKP